jgi:hypothetical protein
MVRQEPSQHITREYLAVGAIGERKSTVGDGIQTRGEGVNKRPSIFSSV